MLEPCTLSTGADAKREGERDGYRHSLWYCACCCVELVNRMISIIVGISLILVVEVVVWMKCSFD